MDKGVVGVKIKIHLAKFASMPGRWMRIHPRFSNIFNIFNTAETVITFAPLQPHCWRCVYGVCDDQGRSPSRTLSTKWEWK